MNRAWDRFEPRWLRQRWPALLAGAAALLLLLAFHQVVTGAVLQGELRRKASAAHVEASWRCQALGGPARRQACQAQLDRPGL